MAIHRTQENFNAVALGIDPGRDKTGFAFIDMAGDLILSGILASNDIEKFLTAVIHGNAQDILKFRLEGANNANFLTGTSLKFIALGNGTHSQKFYEFIKNIFERENFANLKIILVDEKNSTLEARKLFFKIHKPNFLKRLLPESLLIPERVIDDFAAWVIVLRGLKLFESIV